MVSEEDHVYTPIVIENMIEKIDYEDQDAMDSLWEASIELPTKIFTEKQIQVLTSKM